MNAPQRYESRRKNQQTTATSAKPKKGTSSTTLKTTNEEKKIILSEEVAKYPRPSSVKAPALDITAAGNPLISVIHSSIIEIISEKPFSTPESHNLNTTVSLAGMAYYLLWCSFAHFRRVRCLTGADVNDASYADPPRDAPIPGSLAKFLEYFGPYRDPLTAATYQRMIKWTTWPTITGVPLAFINSASSFLLNTGNASRTYYQIGTNKGEAAASSATYADTLGILDLIANQDVFLDFFSGCEGVVNLSSIPPVAPDASACSFYDSSFGLCYCPTIKFDPQITELMPPQSGSNTTALWFSKPRVLDNKIMDAGDSLQAAPVTTVYDRWAYVLARCEWRGGKLKNMLKHFKYGALKTIATTYVPINFAIFESILGATEEAQSQIPGITYQENDLMFFDLVCKQALFARLASTSWIGVWTKFCNNVDYDPTYLTTPLPPLIANYISGIGPVVCSGRLYLPHSYMAYNYYYAQLLEGISRTSTQSIISTAMNADTSAWVPTVPGLTLNSTGEPATLRPHTTYYVTLSILALYKNSALFQNYAKVAIPVGRKSLGGFGVLQTLETDKDWSSSPMTQSFGTSVCKNRYLPQYNGVHCPLRMSVCDNLKAPYTALSLDYSYDLNTKVSIEYATNLFTLSEAWYPLPDLCAQLLTESYINAFGVARGEGLVGRDKDPMQLVRKLVNDQVAAVPAQGETAPWLDWAWTHAQNSFNYVYDAVGVAHYKKLYEDKGLAATWRTLLRDLNSGARTAGEIFQIVRALSGRGGPTHVPSVPLIEAAPGVIIEEVDD